MDGDVELEVAPRHTLLKVGEQLTLSVTEKFAELTRVTSRNRTKKRSLRLQDARLLVARAVPTDNIGIWHEATPGVVTRLFGLRQHTLESGADVDEFNDRWRKLARLVTHLERALGRHSGGVERALEVGAGADRVLVMDCGDHLLFHVRRLFREHPRRAFKVERNGTITVLQAALFQDPAGGRRRRQGKDPPSFTCTFRLGVMATGDYLRFADRRGEDLGRISLPWIRPEDRAHLVKIIKDTISPAPGA